MLLVLGLFASLAGAMVCEGDVLDSDNQWKLICSFNYEMTGGLAEFNITSLHPYYRHQVVALYHDFESGGFADIAKTTKNCADKLKLAKRVTPINAIGKTGFTVRIISKARARFWYVVIANCGGPGVEDVYDYDNYDEEDLAEMMAQKQIIYNSWDPSDPESSHPNVDALGPTHKIFRQEGIYIRNYKFHLTNDGGKFKKEFSYSDQGIFEAEIFCLIVLLFLLPLSFYLHYKLSTANKLNAAASLRWIMWLEWIAFVDTAVMIAHLDVYSRDGIGLPVVLVLSELINAAIHYAFMAVFCLMAKGMWLDPKQFNVKEQRGVMEIMGIYLVLTALLLWHAFTIDDPVADDYVYNTIPGYIIAAMRTVLAFWFLVSLSLHFYRLPDKYVNYQANKFVYASVGVVGFFWLLSPLLLVLLGQFHYHWERKRYMVVCEELLTLLALAWMNPILYCNSQRQNVEDSNTKDGFTGVSTGEATE